MVLTSCLYNLEVKERLIMLQFQADVETDEVYAQMTLQPLTPVSKKLPMLMYSPFGGLKKLFLFVV